jgi:hypothetical protein
MSDEKSSVQAPNEAQPGSSETRDVADKKDSVGMKGLLTVYDAEAEGQSIATEENEGPHGSRTFMDLSYVKSEDSFVLFTRAHDGFEAYRHNKVVCATIAGTTKQGTPVPSIEDYMKGPAAEKWIVDAINAMLARELKREFAAKAFTAIDKADHGS